MNVQLNHPLASTSQISSLLTKPNGFYLYFLVFLVPSYFNSNLSASTASITSLNYCLSTLTKTRPSFITFRVIQPSANLLITLTGARACYKAETAILITFSVVSCVLCLLKVYRCCLKLPNIPKSSGCKNYVEFGGSVIILMLFNAQICSASAVR